MSVLSAYRADVARNGGEFGAFDNDWIQAGCWIEYAIASYAEKGSLAFDEAAAGLPGLLDRDELARVARGEWAREAATPLETFFVFGILLQTAGAWGFADAIARQLLAVAGIDDADRGRFLALRARISRKRDETDLARDQFLSVHRIGKRLNNAELLARAALGLAAIAQRHGKCPQVKRYSRRAARLGVSAGLPRTSAQAYYGLMAESAKRGDFADASVAAWEMLKLTHVESAYREYALHGLGQLLIDSGEFSTGRKVLVKLVQGTVDRKVALSAIGGIAIASARLGDAETVEWAIERMREVRASAAPSYELASALLDCAQAASVVRMDEESAVLRAEALSLAAAHGFHEFAIKAESLADRSLPSVHDEHPAHAPPSQRVLRALAKMPDDELPRRIELAAAGSAL
jgi:hypothetical protein